MAKGARKQARTSRYFVGNVTPARPECRGSRREKRLLSDPFTLISQHLNLNENVCLCPAARENGTTAERKVSRSNDQRRAVM